MNYEFQIEPMQNIVDTTAAGDSFNGAYLAQRLEGVCIEDSVKLASKGCRSSNCTKRCNCTYKYLKGFL